eukprot:c17806_g1_i1 orf=440-1387(-)
MKFNKQFSAFVATQHNLLPGVSHVQFKRLKKLLKHCPHHHSSSSLAKCCPECDQIFFPLLMKEVADVLGCFNARVQRLLEIHLASGFRKYVLRLKYRSSFGDGSEMISEGQNLASYVSMNALAIQKILKKYDKVHVSKNGQAFKSRLQTMHVELLQSPWLVELIAFHLNLKEKALSDTEMSSRCSFDLKNSKPTVSFILSASIKLEIDLTCSICLDMVFDPVALRCGHMFCNSCACSAASVPTVEGLKTAAESAKCPLCREEKVYQSAVHLIELSTLISTRCQDYWEQRLQMERADRLEQARKHWDQQCRAALGL